VTTPACARQLGDALHASARGIHPLEASAGLLIAEAEREGWAR
jgi:hypothetical protein